MRTNGNLRSKYAERDSPPVICPMRSAKPSYSIGKFTSGPGLEICNMEQKGAHARPLSQQLSPK